MHLMFHVKHSKFKKILKKFHVKHFFDDNFVCTGEKKS